MKAFIAAMILFAALVGVAFFSYCKLTSMANALAKEAEELSEVADEQRKEASRAVAKRWEESRFLFSLTINHNEIDALESTLARLSTTANIEDGDDFLIAAAELTAALTHIRDLCAVSIDNIL